MGTLIIGGKRIKVDDSFAKLSPAEQQATVDEIAAQMETTPATDSTAFDEAVAAASAASQQLRGNGRPEPSMLDAGLAAVENTIEGIPFLGPLTQRASDFIGTQAGGLMTGQDPAQLQAELDARRRGRDEQFPLTAISGNLTGNIASLGGLAALPGGAAALGLEGALLPRMGNSALSGAGISMLDERARGGDNLDVLTSGAIGGTLGGLIPGLGAAIKGVAKPVLEPIGRTVRGALNPSKEAATLVGNALGRDQAQGGVMSAADLAAARMNGQPIINVDRGGEVTRGLMRSAANQNPEARAIVEKTAGDRFATQGTRTADFLTRLVGGNVDDVAFREGLKATASRVNKPAYDAVRNVDLNLGNLGQNGVTAITEVTQTPMGKQAFNAAIQMMQNDGVWRGKMTVELVDYAKRALDDIAEAAARSGNNNQARIARDMARKLTATVDAAVPGYKTARQGAALFFGAEDALDAGKKAWLSPKSIDETRRAWSSMSQAEKDAFRVGLVGEVMDQMRNVNNRSNLMRAFDTDAKKELLRLALGPGKGAQFEAFVRVEDILDKMRGALGNSTTTRQLVELGLTAGAGTGAGVASYGLSGGNLTTGATIGLLVAAGRAGSRNVNASVLQRVAEMLASGDEAVIARAVSNAMLSKQHMAALEAIQKGIGVTTRATAMTALN